MRTENDNILEGVDLDRLPAHIAVIMDGNGRWAKKQGLKRIRGHRAGVESIRDVVTFLAGIGIRYLTLYAFSTENWSRPKYEVNMLMKLLDEYLRKELATFKENNIIFNVIGKIDGLPAFVRERIEEDITATRNNTGMTLTLALNYSGRSEITHAVRQIAQNVADGRLAVKDIDENLISDNLFTKGIPDPDLLIRTSGELRVSNFLLWQISYSEIWITPLLWPDMRRQHMVEAIRDFQKRERRFGGV